VYSVAAGAIEVTAFARVSKTHNKIHHTMTKSEKKKLLANNTILWLAAMVLPVVLYFALASTRFPWPVVLPLLLFGAMLASNNLLAKAIGDTTDDSRGR
jgi:hypothetical protein